MSYQPLDASYLDPTQFSALLGLFEGNIPRVYNDGSGNPTIGIGLNLSNSENMAIVLYQIAPTLFTNPPTGGTAQMVAKFDSIISSNPLTGPNDSGNSENSSTKTLIALLNQQLATYLNKPVDQLTTSFNNFLPNNALTALQDALVGGSIIPNYSSITGYSQGTLNWLQGGNPWGIDVASANIPGQNTSAWEALESLFFNQDSKNPLLGKQLLTALNAGNLAEAWFQIRYGSNHGWQAGTNIGVAKRRYTESQLFGLYANPSAPTETESLQAFQMLTANRPTIMNYEAQYGSDPYGSGSITPTNAILAANQAYGSTIGIANQVQTLAQAFDAAANEEIQYLNGLYSTVLPTIAVNDTGSSVFDTFNLRSVDFFAASATDQLVDAVMSDAPTAAEQEADASADHVLLGSETGDTLIGAFGDDILIGQAGNELLEAGTGADTLIADAGNDTLQAAGTSDVMDFVFPVTSGYKETVEMNGGSGAGAIDVNGSSIGGGLSYLGNDTWIGNGNTYTYIQNPSDLPVGYAPGAGAPAVGELQILVGGQGGNEIDIWGFNLTAAEYSAGGYLGIKLPASIYITSGATTGVDPPTPDFTSGSTQSYTVSVNAPSTSAQTVSVTLSGAPASDFEAQIGSTVVPLNSNGTFTFILAAGQTSAAFSLVNTADVGQNASLQLVASVANPSDPSGKAITSTLTQSFVETSPDPFLNNGGSSVAGESETENTTGFQYTLYQGGFDAGQAEQMVLTGADNYVTEAGENDFITVTAPGKNNIIIGSGAVSSNTILLNGATTLAQAFTQSWRDTARIGRRQWRLPGRSAPRPWLPAGNGGLGELRLEV